jgi:cytochrome c-type biogenesis protein
MAGAKQRFIDRGEFGPVRFAPMTGVDILFGFLGGLLSCLTPEALLLLPLALAVAGGAGRASVIATAVGLGLSLVLTGLLAGSLGPGFGFEATLFRRIVCAVLVLQGIALMSAALVDQYRSFTGGHGSMFDRSGATGVGGALRRLLLALFIGANWIPQIGPALGKASLMAADIRNSGLALAVLFAYGVGAAIPWIVVGRVIRFVLHPFAGGVLHGMAGQRLLGLSLLAVAVLGSTGLDITMANWLSPKLPAWSARLSTRF